MAPADGLHPQSIGRLRGRMPPPGGAAFHPTAQLPWSKIAVTPGNAVSRLLMLLTLVADQWSPSNSPQRPSGPAGPPKPAGLRRPDTYSGFSGALHQQTKTMMKKHLWSRDPLMAGTPRLPPKSIQLERLHRQYAETLLESSKWRHEAGFWSSVIPAQEMS